MSVKRILYSALKVIGVFLILYGVQGKSRQGGWLRI